MDEPRLQSKANRSQNLSFFSMVLTHEYYYKSLKSAINVWFLKQDCDPLLNRATEKVQTVISAIPCEHNRDERPFQNGSYALKSSHGAAKHEVLE